MAESTSKFTFKSSKLSSAAEKLWEQRKSEFKYAISSQKTTESCNKLHKEEKNSGHKSKLEAKNGGVENDSNPFRLSTKIIIGGSSDFVFGAKVAERVVTEENRNNENSKKSEMFASDETQSSFHKLAEQAEENDKQIASTSKKLKESAAEILEKSKKTESFPDQISVTTGEEAEHNLYHLQCKLHIFDVESKSWHERGQGTIRINERIDEKGIKETRIVGRTSGNQRVILNSNIWSEMLLEKSTGRRIKLSAIDPETEEPLMFLVTASEYNIEALFHVLQRKLSDIKKANRKRRQEEQLSEEDAKKTPKTATP